jgi:hypothetical protein
MSSLLEKQRCALYDPHIVTTYCFGSFGEFVELDKQGNSPMSPIFEADDTSQLRPCCEATISLHAKNNAMMVCGTCKHIIKCFSEERAYKNYLKFCDSRHRKIVTGRVDGYHIVIFRST